MFLAEEVCWARLRQASHGVLATVHDRRGVDAVPVVFAVCGQQLVVPIDTVKAKTGGRPQRLVNLERDDRCVLLVELYSDDWSQLWWVRAHARAVEAATTDEHRAALAGRYPQYRAEGAVVGSIVVTPYRLTGWAAASPS